MPEGFFDGAIVSRRFYRRILVDYRRFFVDYQRNGCGYRRIFVDYQRFSVDYRHFNKKGDIQVKWMSLTSQAFGFGLLYSFGLAIGGSLSTISATGVAIGGFLSTISVSLLTIGGFLSTISATGVDYQRFCHLNE